MLKLLARVPYNAFWALDVFLSAVTFGAKGQTISARLWETSLSTKSYVKYPFVGLRYVVDAVAYSVFGEKNHTQVSYNAWVASKAILGLS